MMLIRFKLGVDETEALAVLHYETGIIVMSSGPVAAPVGKLALGYALE